MSLINKWLHSTCNNINSMLTTEIDDLMEKSYLDQRTYTDRLLKQEIKIAALENDNQNISKLLTSYTSQLHESKAVLEYTIHDKDQKIAELTEQLRVANEAVNTSSDTAEDIEKANESIRNSWKEDIVATSLADLIISKDRSNPPGTKDYPANSKFKKKMGKKK